MGNSTLVKSHNLQKVSILLLLSRYSALVRTISFSPFLSKWRKKLKNRPWFQFFWNPQSVWSEKSLGWPSFQVRKLEPSRLNIPWNSKKSIKFEDFFETDNGSILRTWKLGHREIFSLHTNWGFQIEFEPWQDIRSFAQSDFQISSSFGQKWRKRNCLD